MRCALIEFNGYHEEVLPVLVRLLNELGIKPDVYMVRYSRGRRPFDRAPELRLRRRQVERMDRWWGLPFRLRRYDLLIVNSMEPARIPERLARVRTPILGVVHNTELLTEDAGYRAFFSSSRRQPLVLWRHIAERVGRGGRAIGWISHVYFGEPEPIRADGPTTFAVSGNVEFHRRDYEALLAAAAELVAEAVPFRVRIIGRSNEADGQELRRRIDARGLADVFEFSPGEIPHPVFFGLVAGSDFVLPLIDPSVERLRPYFETKLASSIPFAIGLRVPLVMHHALAAAYGIERCGPTYDDGQLAGAMRRAIESGTEERSRWRAEIETKRTEILAASVRNLSEAISAVRR
jgi:glycosyltransferase involved in cell wall biosynthesis